MKTNITAEKVKEYTLNHNLASLDSAKIERYIERALTLVSARISAENFQKDGGVVFPDDLVVAIVCIIEYLFIDNGLLGGGKNDLKSEKIGNYSYTKKDGKAPGFDLDLPANILAVLDRYSSRGGNIWIDIGGYDRDYF